jgi:uroporphyrinogen decarboxylase
MAITSPIIPKRKYPADFGQLEKVLKREKPDRPVLFEYFMNGNLISLVNKVDFNAIPVSVERIAAIVRFFNALGYDHATIPARYFSNFSFPVETSKKETISLNDGAAISCRKSFDDYPWPDPARIRPELLGSQAIALPEGMKLIIPGPGGLLENVIPLTGFENLCYMIYEDEELVSEIFNKTGELLLMYYEICCETDTVGALIVNDDWGFKTQTMLSPDMLRKFVFPWQEKIVRAIHSSGKYAILHSCGNIYEVMEDVISNMKFDAKHSFEDNILPVEEAYRDWHEKIAILGGIDMDFLVRETPDNIFRRCRKLIEITGFNGYALGSGNSIPPYVPVENYLAMIRAADG